MQRVREIYGIALHTQGFVIFVIQFQHFYYIPAFMLIIFLESSSDFIYHVVLFLSFVTTAFVCLFNDALRPVRMWSSGQSLRFEMPFGAWTKKKQRLGHALFYILAGQPSLNYEHGSAQSKGLKFPGNFDNLGLVLAVD